MRVHGISRQRPEWGEARVVTPPQGGDELVLEYFTVPGVEPLRTQAAPGDVLPPLYEKGQRIFFADETGVLRSGRLAEQGLHEARHVALEYPGPASSGPVLLINANGRGRRSLPPEAVEVCSELEIIDPTPVLAAMANEGSWWFHARTALAHNLARERAVFRGLSGLASAAIEMNDHQIEVAKKILRDPVCRYILADEVGLGKTVEAGIVIRQHVLETDDDFKVLVVVPDHLIEQWTAELSEKFGLAEELALGSVGVCAFRGVADLVEGVWEGRSPSMLVVDEAHHLAPLAFSPAGDDADFFGLMSRISDDASRVLLLSATPVLRDTAGFLAMLHLMDQRAYPLGDLEGFTKKVESREAVAEVAFLLSRPVLPLLRSGLLARLEQALGADETVWRLREGLAEAWASGDDASAEVYRKKLHGYIRSAFQVYRRLVRTRRDDPSVAGALPERRFKVVEVESEFHRHSSDFLDDWRLARLDTRRGSEPEPALAELFANWVALCLESPPRFVEALRSRREELSGGLAEAFSDEAALLDRYLPDLEQLSEEAVEAIITLLEEYDTGDRLVVFLSDESICEIVSLGLRGRAAVLQGKVPEAHIVLVSRAGEEGVNLQRLSAELLHADLPLSTVRIEQRIGRMDRLNAANMFVRSVVVATPGTYQGVWVDAVASSARVLFRSISALQYLIADAEGVLKRELLEHGREAFQRFSSELARPEGPLSLDEEEKRLKAQDTLDSARVDRREGISQGIEDYEFEEYVETVNALKQWTVDGLRFQPFDAEGHCIDGPFDAERPHRLKVSDKDLTRSKLRRWFASALDRSPTGLPFNLKGRVTVVSAGDRRRALAAGAALLRVGHPLVTGIQKMLTKDDRGRTFAVLCPPLGDNLEVFFRFDISLEGRLSDDNPTLTRRLEEVLLPQYLTLWLDAEGRVLDEEQAQACGRALSSAGSRSVVGADAWETVLQGLAADWPTLVFGVREVALTVARTHDAWMTALQEARENVAAARGELQATLRARMAVGQSDADSEMWGRELFFLDQLSEIIDAAGPQVEAAGALFQAVALPR